MSISPSLFLEAYPREVAKKPITLEKPSSISCFYDGTLAVFPVFRRADQGFIPALELIPALSQDNGF